MIIDTNFELLILNKSASTFERRGVAIENVVAVPAISAITASKSIVLPKNPSVYWPSIGLHASEYFCLWHPLTCSMKPKHAARTA